MCSVIEQLINLSAVVFACVFFRVGDTEIKFMTDGVLLKEMETV